MIHIATVHWQTDKWIDIQLKYLKKYIKQEFRVYAFLNRIDKSHYSKFYYVIDESIRKHAIKLNLLAEIISLQAKPDEILIFLDGDAFPVNPMDDYLNNKLAKFKFIAIQRTENLGDIQPHPSFASCKVKFWNDIHGDWKGGKGWTNNTGRLIKDSGGRLFSILETNKIDWYKLKSIKQLSKYPTFFSIYDNIIYHHVGGFRVGVTREFHNKNRTTPIKRGLLYYLLNKIPEDILIRLKNNTPLLYSFRRRLIVKKFMSLSTKYFSIIQKEGIEKLISRS